MPSLPGWLQGPALGERYEEIVYVVAGRCPERMRPSPECWGRGP